MHPDQDINCLLVYPRFSQFSFWNTREVVKAVGAKAPSPPLGLITVAALLPQNWNFKLLDLNTTEFDEDLWAWADIVCVSGMLPQQDGILSVIERANRDGKFVAVGGPDPTSQPEVYSGADALVMGEGEITIPIWLESWRNGKRDGRFESPDKPDVTTSPIPRYDLLELNDYYAIGVQYARGCPFNCEFCDIIELFGRKPRHKSPYQLISELQTLYDLGYRGLVEIVDDNFIGNKRHVKRELLPALIKWNKERRKPFYFGTEASMNLADDVKLLEMMKQAEFRLIFMGIETPDPDLLMKTQKSHNTIRPIVDRVHRVFEYGMIVTAGFIIGFDGEKKGTDQSIVRCIEDTGICMAMIGMLVALPNTQLSRRLRKEGRLLTFSGQVVSDENQDVRATTDSAGFEIIDQTLAGLNFATSRDRFEIMREFTNAVSTVYEPSRYFSRVLRSVKSMKYKPPRLAHWFELKRQLRGLVWVSRKMLGNKSVRWLFAKTAVRSLFLGLSRFETAMTLMSLYIHFEDQVKYLKSVLPHHEELQRHFPRSAADLKAGSVEPEIGQVIPPPAKAVEPPRLSS